MGSCEDEALEAMRMVCGVDESDRTPIAMPIKPQPLASGLKAQGSKEGGEKVQGLSMHEVGPPAFLRSPWRRTSISPAGEDEPLDPQDLTQSVGKITPKRNRAQPLVKKYQNSL